jgi:hypothetical protein
MDALTKRAQDGLTLIEGAIVELLQTRPNGLTNVEITSRLQLESDQDGKQRDYLAWSVLGRLMKQGSVVRTTQGKRQVYQLKS